MTLDPIRLAWVRNTCGTWLQVRYAFLAGLAVVVLLIPLNRWLASKIEGASERMMSYKDTRLQRMGELLHGILQIKMYAWEPRFISKVWPLSVPRVS